MLRKHLKTFFFLFFPFSRYWNCS